MNPIESFLEAMETELRGNVSEPAMAEILAELRDHLQDSAEELRATGSLNPEADAVAEFGQAKKVGQELAAERNRARYSTAEKAALSLAALAAVTPMALDLLVDLSSWLTGSDFRIFLIWYLVALWCLALFVASIRCRRLLSRQIAGIVLASGFVGLVVGGFSRGAQPGPWGTQTRGTALQRMKGLLSERDGIGRIQVVQDKLQAGVTAFATGNLGVFRQDGGYIVPKMDGMRTQIWQDDPRGWRYRYEAIDFGSTASLSEAKRLWAERGPEMIKLTQDGIRGNIGEAAELRKVVWSSWGETIRREFPIRGGFTLFGLIVLVGANLLGTGIGAMSRRWRRRGTA